jgi:hypothetical protein
MGLWSDYWNYCTYEGNVVEYNHGHGIMHEISYDALIRCNVSAPTVFAPNTTWRTSTSRPAQIPKCTTMSLSPTPNNGRHIWATYINRSDMPVGGGEKYNVHHNDVTVQNQHLRRVSVGGSVGCVVLGR